MKHIDREARAVAEAKKWISTLAIHGEPETLPAFLRGYIRGLAEELARLEPRPTPEFLYRVADDALGNSNVWIAGLTAVRDVIESLGKKGGQTA